jgi:hypothetical protein
VNAEASHSLHVEAVAFSFEPRQDFVFADERTPHLFPRSVTFERAAPYVGKSIGGDQQRRNILT